jgi:hypothetical protein
MPKLIPIQDYIDNCCKEYITDTNVLSNEIIIQIPENTEKQIENTQTSEITDNINKVDEIDEEYVDINISDVEPYTNNNESCMIM